MPTGTAVTPNRRGSRSRELVLDAAERVMAEHGFANASMARVVEEAGIPASSIYHYFGSKDGVLLAVMERGAERFFAAIPEPDELMGTPEGHLAALMKNVTSALEENPEFLRLLVTMAAQPDEDAAVQEVVTRVRDTALGRLRSQFALAFDARPNAKRIDRLARTTLALVDGAFIATQADEKVKLASLLEPVPALLTVLVQLDT